MRCFYASDIHGSEVCWRKFLNAGRFYKADVLIMGGDIVGKALVPIVMETETKGRARLHSRDVKLDSADAIAAFETEVRDSGFYPLRATPEDIALLDASDEARQAAFERVVRSELARWVEIAEEKKRDDVAVYVMPGNDDPWFIDEELSHSDAVAVCDERVVQVDGSEMISLSYANPTPWDSPRELEEEELFAHIESLANRLSDCSTAIFNLHVPPHASGLDDAPRLDETLRPITKMGQVEIVPVGSHAVRRAIEEFQPLVSLHGHIHESRGVRKIGRTVVINPGSEYTSGRIHGALFEIKRGRLKSHQLITG